MTTREKIDLMTKVNAANEQRIAEYLINGHTITPTSPVTLDIATCIVRTMQRNIPILRTSWESLRLWAEREGYDPDIIEKAVRRAGERR